MMGLDQDLVQEHSGWLRVNGAAPWMTLAHSAAGLKPGWFALSLNGIEAALALHPVLQAWHDPAGQDVVDYPASSVRSGELRIVFHTERPIYRLRLNPSIERIRFQVGSSRLRRLSKFGLILEAAARSPRLATEAITARITGKKVRARNRLRRIFGPTRGQGYGAWLSQQVRPWAAEVPSLLAHSQTWTNPPRFALILVLDTGEVPSSETVRCFADQIYPHCEWIIVGAPSSLRSLADDLHEDRPIRLVEASSEASMGERIRAGLNATDSAWAILAQNHDLMPADSVLRLACAAVDHPDVRLIYGDDDIVDASGNRRAPRFKPNWDRELFLATDYLGPGTAIRIENLKTAAAGPDTPLRDQDHARLRITAHLDDAAIFHIPRLVYHRREALPHTLSDRAQAVQEALAYRGEKANVSVNAQGHIRVTRPVPSPAPLVSAIVCTRDRMDLLRPCIEGLRSRTDYAPLEILIADNDSREPETLAYFRDLAADTRVRILPCPGPFNFAAINNRAARIAQGSVLLFLNNDIEVITPEWLTEMVAHATRSESGAVGAKLLYPDGRIQHGGVVIGLNGLAGHAHRFYPGDHAGYMGRLQAVQTFSAVTAACLAVAREKFFEVDGFDETAFPVAFNDVDLCLKLLSQGYRNLWTPYAVLAHKESASRVKDMSPERRHAFSKECFNLRSRWSDLLANDRYYNPNLTQTDEDFSLR
ncbi:glycosyltransferase [Microvirga sp. TS319]|uniref:glycosyltransferase family 2 protein n=1 Tax=Microvirga sp. TS319 TaxID=3241165 RepID=UPI00351A5D43